eukprot:gene4882-8476_t
MSKFNDTWSETTESQTTTTTTTKKRKLQSEYEEGGIDIEDIPFSFSKMYDVEEIRDLIQQFTIEKRCEENIAFIQRVDAYRVLKNSYNRYLEATKIMFTFLQPHAQYELNLPHKEKTILNQQFTSCTEDHCPFNLFDVVSLIIFFELERDNAPGFLKSESWKKFIRRNQHLIKDIIADEDQELEEETKSDSPKDKKKDTRPERFKPTITAAISDSDFQLFTNLQPEEYWTTLSKEQSYTVSVSKNTIQCDGSSFYMIRETGFLPFEPNDILNGYCAGLTELHNGLEKIENIDYIPIKNDGPGSVCILKYKLPSFKPREFVVCFSAKRNKPKKSIMLLLKNCNHTKAKLSKGYVRGNMHGCLMIELKSSSLCKVSYYSYIDLGEGISASMYNTALHQRKIFLLPKLNDVILKRKTENAKRPLNHHRILDTYDELVISQKSKRTVIDKVEEISLVDTQTIQ